MAATKTHKQLSLGPSCCDRAPAKHMMCYAPGGIRVELMWSGDEIASTTKQKMRSGFSENG